MFTFKLHAAPQLMDADNLELTGDLEPDMVGCDRVEQIVDPVSFIDQFINQLNLHLE